MFRHHPERQTGSHCLAGNTAESFITETVAAYLSHTPNLQRLKHVDD
jgi:hypothetical protein